MERRLSTIMAIDLVGYSRLMSVNEDNVINKLRDIRVNIIDPLIVANGGRVVKTMGDGILIEFASPVSAVGMATNLQEQMHKLELEQPEEEKFRFRVGINTGEVVLDAGEVLGDCVNIAARLESIAPPGGICIGKTVFDLANGNIDASLTSLGPQNVKNIPDPILVWRVEIEGVVAPPAVSAHQERISLAVLPFDNMSSDPDQNFLADGMVEDVITELSRFRSLFVIARNSTFAYKSANKDIRKIGRELGVQYIVEGSVRRAGQRLRITAQLVETETGTHIWAERWDRTMDDLFDLQDELTAAIVSAIEPELGAHERSRTLRKPIESLTVWELCFRGHDWHTNYTTENFENCERLIRRALDIEPNSVRANVLLSRLQVTRVFLGVGDQREAARTECLVAGRRAVALDERDDHAQRALGIALVAAERFEEAEDCLNRGIALNPNNSSLFYSRAYCWLRAPYEDPEKVASDIEMAIKLSPRDTLKVHYLGVLAMGWLSSKAPMRLEKAIEALDAAAHQSRPYWIYSLLSAAVYAEMGDLKNAQKFVTNVVRQNPEVCLANAPTAIPLPAWAESWRQLSQVGEQLVELGLPRS